MQAVTRADVESLEQLAEDLALHQDGRVHLVHAHRSYLTHRWARLPPWPVARIASITDIFVLPLMWNPLHTGPHHSSSCTVFIGERNWEQAGRIRTHNKR